MEKRENISTPYLYTRERRDTSARETREKIYIRERDERYARYTREKRDTRERRVDTRERR